MPYYALTPDNNTIDWSEYDVRVATRNPLTSCPAQAVNEDGPVYPNCWCLEYDAPANAEVQAILPDGKYDLTASECRELLETITTPDF